MTDSDYRPVGALFVAADGNTWAEAVESLSEEVGDDDGSQ